jgi:hypothetical protein
VIYIVFPRIIVPLCLGSDGLLGPSDPESEGTTVFTNVGKYLPNIVVPHPRRLDHQQHIFQIDVLLSP